MEIKGTVNRVMQMQSGTSQSGNQWVKQEFSITTLDEKYPKEVAFTLFGEDRIKQANIQGGQLVTVKFDAESRLYNDRFYTQLTAWSVVPVQATVPQQQPMQQAPFAGQPMQASAPYSQQAGQYYQGQAVAQFPPQQAQPTQQVPF